MLLKNILAERVSTFEFGRKGVQIIEDATSITIYNDPFCSVPVFFARAGDETVVFSDFEDFYSLEEADASIDPAGFWEILLFGTCLWTRTLYKAVRQMPAATKLVIDKASGETRIERYWNFAVEADASIDTMDKAASGLYERLEAIFSRLDAQGRYVMGLSGGLDSRITLAFLSRHVAPENLELFTYGFDPRILEHQYARQLAAALGFGAPRFHRLSEESYRNALERLPRQGGGQIGIGHCHMLDYLQANRERLEGRTQVSAYYTDALFGWACSGVKKNDAAKDSSLYATLRAASLDDAVREPIARDIEAVLADYAPEANFCDVDEYKYLAERNPRFHLYLASLQNQLVPTLTPYADTELLRFMLSVPLEFRAHKRIIDRLLENHFPEVSLARIGSISSRFQKAGGGRFSGKLEWWRFKLLNRTNALLRVATGGRVELLNRFQTEEQERLLRRYFGPKVREAAALFEEKGLFTPEQRRFYQTLPVKAGGVQERYGLMTLKTLV